MNNVDARVERKRCAGAVIIAPEPERSEPRQLGCSTLSEHVDRARLEHEEEVISYPRYLKLSVLLFVRVQFTVLAVLCSTNNVCYFRNHSVVNVCRYVLAFFPHLILISFLFLCLIKISLFFTMLFRHCHKYVQFSW